ncbi:hypothetical protein Tco_0913210 [Tanacetum coccineum]
MASMNTRLNIKKLDENIGAQEDREAEVFQVSNDDTVVAQRRLKDKQLEEKTNTDCLSGLSKVFWAEDTIRSTYLVNRPPSSAIGFKKPIDMLGIVGNKLWRLDVVTSNVVLYKNMSFNESGEYKKTFIGSDVGTGSMQVLHGFEFEVKPLGDHTFELARDREQHLACELLGYREDSNESSFALAAVEKIYAHESLTFHNTVTCEVISKWKAGLKDDMDVRLDVYVLNNGCRKCSDDNHDYYWEYAAPGMFIHLFLYIDGMVCSYGCKAETWVTKGLLVKAKGNILGLEIIRDQSGNTLRVSQSRIHNEKLVQTLLKGHSTLSLEDSLSRDCDMEKNGKWSYIYAVGSQEYQVVCTRPDIASAGVDMLDGLDRGLQTSVQHMEALSTTEAGYMTFTEAWKKKIWLKGLLTKSRYELRLVAGITTGALVKGCSRSEVPAQVKVSVYRY